MKIPASAQAESLHLFKELLRQDTSNPPGNERPAAELLAESLRADGLEPELLEKEKGRTSVVARLKGTGEKRPLLLTAHLDVVSAEGKRWRHPPFAAMEEDGWIFGRGTIDMKHMAVMSVMALKLLAREGVRLERDLIFAGAADEEAGCALGSEFLVNEYPEKVRAEYALGEIGGYTQLAPRGRLYPIQVAQKGIAWVRARVEGTPGHGSIPREDNPVWRLSRALARLDPEALPVHPSDPARQVIAGYAQVQSLLGRLLMPRLLNPALTSHILKLIPDRAARRVLNALLRNTAAPTVLRAGAKTNVIPSFAEAEIDGRTVPGQQAEGLMEELRHVLGPEVQLELLRKLDPLVVRQDTPLFELLCQAVREMDPQGIPIPLLIPGFTDAGPFSRLGITYYGFSPVVFPPDSKVSFSEMFHGDDERIPVQGFLQGMESLYWVARDFCSAKSTERKEPSQARAS